MEIEPIYNLDLFNNGKQENGRYSPTQKYFATLMLDTDRKEVKGNDSPQFEKYSRLLNIPAVTLKSWIANKDSIYKESSAIAKTTIQAVQMQIAMSIPEIYNTLMTRMQSGEMRDSDIISFFREGVQKMRLLGNQSTNNTEVNVNHFTPIVPKNLK